MWPVLNVCGPELKLFSHVHTAVAVTSGLTSVISDCSVDCTTCCKGGGVARLQCAVMPLCD